MSPNVHIDQGHRASALDRGRTGFQEAPTIRSASDERD
jgi:hypothetical protein